MRNWSLRIRSKKHPRCNLHQEISKVSVETRSYDTEGLVEACGAATLEERHQLLTMMLDAVYGGMA